VTVFDFRTQLAKGHAAEDELLRSYHRPALRFDGREFDLIDNRANRIEVKTEFRSLSSTANFFIEFQGNVEKAKPGGPWSAMQNGANVFVIYFPTDGVYFLTEDVPALVREVTAWARETKAELKIIRNKTWTGSGYAVPRVRLAGLLRCFRIVDGKATEEN